MDEKERKRLIYVQCSAEQPFGHCVWAEKSWIVLDNQVL